MPIPTRLRRELVAHNLRSGRDGGALVSGPQRPYPSSPRPSVAARRKAELDPIALHEARHTFASLLIAAGVNAKALSTYVGHASVTITYDRYGHLMPGNEEEAAGLAAAYLERVAPSPAKAD